MEAVVELQLEPRRRQKLSAVVPPNLTPFHVLTKVQACNLCSLSMDVWNELDRRGDTPAKVKLSPGRVGYVVKDIVAWLEKRRTRLPDEEVAVGDRDVRLSHRRRRRGREMPRRPGNAAHQ
jgi:hypothetical protein